MVILRVLRVKATAGKPADWSVKDGHPHLKVGASNGVNCNGEHCNSEQLQLRLRLRLRLRLQLQLQLRLNGGPRFFGAF